MQARRSLAVPVAFLAICAMPKAHAQVPVGTDFTYQGQIGSAGAPLDGTADFRFRLFDAISGGNQIGATVSRDAVTVADGLFTLRLDFGADAFDGDARWLQVAVRSPSGTGTFTTLTPRQTLTAAPYALKVPGIDGHSLDAADGSPTDAVFVNNAGRVGIGTTSPLAKLEVIGDWDGQEGAVHIRGDKPTISMTGGPIAGNQSWKLHVGSDNGGALTVARNLTPTTFSYLLNLTPQDRVGIGTRSPTSKLEIAAQDGLAITGYQPFFTLRDANAGNARGVIQSVAGDLNFFTNASLATGIPPLKVRNDGTTMVRVLEITGADLAEKFPTSESVEPGMAVAIDAENPGKLCRASGAYNRRVAGIVSGANDFSVGAVLGNLPGHEDSPPIALSGRVYVWCDASAVAIEPGDLLTTSDTPGHAMKATDSTRMVGAVLGKAMTGLPRGERGLVLALVSLQ